MKFQYIDIHSHVNFAAYDADREEVVKRAAEAGVAMINVGTQADTSKKAVEMAEKYAGCYAIVGLHPVHTNKSFHDEKELGLPAATSAEVVAGKGMAGFTSRGESFDSTIYRTMLKHSKVVGIGECGLDYYHLDEESIKKQREDFEKQIALASEVKKPLMLHVRSNASRSAYKDALAILKSSIINHESSPKGNFHFFAGSWNEAKEILDAGFNLSFTGVITFARQYDEVIKNAPLDRIMSETDSPYVTPAPFRGKRNEPMHVREVVKKIAEIRGEDFEVVRATLLENAAKFFGIAL